jgi:eukaryotic-like serine/threonine-protein kinase
MTLLDLADNELRPASPGHDAEHAHAVGSSLCAASANGSAASGSAAAGPHRAGTGKVQELRPGDPRVIGPYRLLGQLGGGGMGRVFLGVSAGGRPVAVKVIRPELVADPEFRTRFRREVAAARTVSGLFTALVVDADTEAPAPWLATAYVAGPSLAQAVRDSGPLSADSVLALAVGLAESLAAIHAVGVVHRDLKPSNVLLAEDGPRVIDFGISWAIEATSLTNAGFVVGSPGFMSPEQAEGGIVGPPSDMFSLGAVLAFSATGEGPFGGGSTAALVYRVVHSSPDLSRLPSQVRPLVERCLAKDPSQRPAAVDFLAQAGPGRRVTGWLGTPVIPAFNWNPAPHSDPAPLADPIPPDANRTVTVGKQLPSPWPVTLQPSFPPPTPPAAASRIRRPRFWRPPTIAWVCGTLLAAFAVAGFALHHGGTQAPAAQAPVAHSKQLPGRSLTDSPAISASPAVSASASARTSPSASASPPARKIARTSPSATSTAQPVRSTAPPVAKPTHQYLFDVKGASWYSCSDEGSIHSVPSTSEELFTFVNNSSTTLQIIWLNFGGSRQLYDVLGPGQSYNVDTYIGHDWLIASPGSGCLGIFGINGSGQIVTSS